MSVTNEGKCCDAVLRVLEQRHGARRFILERDSPRTPGIELRCRIGNQNYCIEHTLIEPFPRSQVDNIAFQRVFDDKFAQRLSGTLDPLVSYTFYVPVYAFAGMNARQIIEVREKLEKWVHSTVLKIPLQTVVKADNL